MPTLEQKENGDYFIRSRIASSGTIITWQVRGMGISFLQKHGVNPGNQFDQKLLQEMIRCNYVFTGGSGTGDTNQKQIAQLELVNKKPAVFSNRDYSFMGNQTQISSKPQLNKVSDEPPGTFARKPILLVFRKYKYRWELLLIFPKVQLDTVDLNALASNNGRLTVNGALKSLKTQKLFSNTGEVSLAVLPQRNTYSFKLLGTGSSKITIWGLLHNAKYFLCDVKGLNPNGTFFIKKQESFEEGIRLRANESLFSGHSYYLIFHKESPPQWFPKNLMVKNLGNVGAWEALEIKLPDITNPELRKWCSMLGYALLD